MTYTDNIVEEFRIQFDELGLKSPKDSMKNMERELIVNYWENVLKQALAEERERVRGIIDEPMNFDSRTSETVIDEIVKIINHERQRILASLDTSTGK